jgi:hypothetical protein
MVTVVGGTYSEFCFDPYWNELYGSGLRGAAAISSLTDVTLHTYISESQKRALEIAANTFRIKLVVSANAATGSFIYQHPLAQPFIEADKRSVVAAPLRVTADVVMRYGMLEGDAITNSEYAVYDPQDPIRPRHFAENGSTAQHLAIIANSTEAKKLTGASDIEQAARVLLSENTEVVVVKQGPLGAVVLTNEKREHVYAYETERVWPIGSGDVFGAVFAYFWGAKRFQPLESARIASLATAFYCESRTLPVPHDIDTRPELPLVKANPSGLQTASVYLAGPFFNMGARWLVEQAREALRQQPVAVFSPFHDVGLGLAESVVPADIEALDRCSAVLALLDHFDPGTVFEIGWAKKRGVPVVAFVQNEREENLKMLTGTGCEIVDDFASAVYRATWRAIA